MSIIYSVSCFYLKRAPGYRKACKNIFPSIKVLSILYYGIILLRGAHAEFPWNKAACLNQSRINCNMLKCVDKTNIGRELISTFHYASINNRDQKWNWNKRERKTGNKWGIIYAIDIWINFAIAFEYPNRLSLLASVLRRTKILKCVPHFREFKLSTG